ncbi:universal stress protein [Blastopirellula sp. JC732]|uniref:Universal stress protein n=1 Tax=Blastopirellula sediminis TaxID=2894196 RepID=A0A9X1MMK1_9BACT|nr:universal stress protein [Blastopirellula sediminis]MCC9609736.1 universal stress protein [Blastopirellula sediminis]MCC9628980.1 universal stress protein [Blastopirellula sediminis]
MTWLAHPPIVVPFDFSPVSKEAVGRAIGLIGSPSGVHVVHVLGELSPAEPGEVWHTVDHATRTKHATEAIIKELGNEVTVKVLFGDAGHQITEYADEIGAKLIIMPSHGRSGILRVLLGSVTDRVVRLAHCPVLVLRPEKPKS